MKKGAVSTGIKLVVASLAVGLLFSVLGITAREVLSWIGVTAGEAIGMGASLLDWAWSYIILGAAVVVPIWLIIMATRHLRRRP